MGFRFEKLSVLLVEDTDPMRKLVISVLETLGIGRIYAADDAEKAYEIFCNERPDIVVTDWHMEPVSGLELVKKIRRNDSSPNKTVPIIMMTGYSALSRVSEARDMGVTEFLVKPFSADGLAKRIAYVINRPRDFVKSGEYFGPDRRRRVGDEYQGPRRRKSDNADNGKGRSDIDIDLMVKNH